MLTQRLLMTGAIFAALAAPAAAAPFNFVQNGSFETAPAFDAGDTAKGYKALLPGVTPGFPNWIVAGKGVDILSTFFPAQDGSFSLDLDGSDKSGPNSAGGILQTVTGLTTGKTYKLSFWVDANPNQFDPKTLRTFVTGDSSNLIDESISVPRNDIADWVEYTYTFVADTDSITLGFESLSRLGRSGPLLDNVSITAIPLPMALPMFMAGLGALGLVRRRRKTEATA